MTGVTWVNDKKHPYTQTHYKKICIMTHCKYNTQTDRQK